MVTQRTNVITASGDQVNITGTIFTVPTAITFLVANSGLGVQMSGQGVLISGQPVSISGQPVLISGQPIIVDPALSSGLNVIVQSGLGVVGSLSSSVSGQPVALVSGTIAINQSGLNVVVQSGLGIVPPAVTAVRARGQFLVTANSGGEALTSGVVTATIIRSLDGDIYVGGRDNIEMPYSGYGLLVQQGDTLSMPVNNFNLIKVCAAVSGNRIFYGGVD